MYLYPCPYFGIRLVPVPEQLKLWVMKASEGPNETGSICKQTPSVKAGGFNVHVVKVNMKYTGFRDNISK